MRRLVADFRAFAWIYVASRVDYTSALGMHSTSCVNGIPIAPLVSYSEERVPVFATIARNCVKIFQQRGLSLNISYLN